MKPSERIDEITRGLKMVAGKDPHDIGGVLPNTEKMKELQVAVAQPRPDSEMIHSLYDDLIEEIAMRHEPKLVKKLQKMVTNIPFWYA